MPKLKRILALSGGIGSGKSTVAAYLCQLGLPHLDMDQVARDMTQKGSKVLQHLVSAFGADILDAQQALDRKKLARKCFVSVQKTAILNGIMHPLIWQASQHWLQQQQSDWAVFEIPLLLESNHLDQVDFVAMVITPLLLRKERVIARGFQSACDFDHIVQRQCTDEERMKAAHFIIENEYQGTMHQQCQRLLAMLPKCEEQIP